MLQTASAVVTPAPGSDACITIASCSSELLRDADFYEVCCVRELLPSLLLSELEEAKDSVGAAICCGADAWKVVTKSVARAGSDDQALLTLANAYTLWSKAPSPPPDASPFVDSLRTVAALPSGYLPQKSVKKLCRKLLLWEKSLLLALAKSACPPLFSCSLLVSSRALLAQLSVHSEEALCSTASHWLFASLTSLAAGFSENDAESPVFADAMRLTCMLVARSLINGLLDKGERRAATDFLFEEDAPPSSPGTFAVSLCRAAACHSVFLTAATGGMAAIPASLLEAWQARSCLQLPSLLLEDDCYSQRLASQLFGALGCSLELSKDSSPSSDTILAVLESAMQVLRVESVESGHIVVFVKAAISLLAGRGTLTGLHGRILSLFTALLGRPPASPSALDDEATASDACAALARHSDAEGRSLLLEELLAGLQSAADDDDADQPCSESSLYKLRGTLLALSSFLSSTAAEPIDNFQADADRSLAAMVKAAAHVARKCGALTEPYDAVVEASVRRSDVVISLCSYPSLHCRPSLRLLCSPAGGTTLCVLQQSRRLCSCPPHSSNGAVRADVPPPPSSPAASSSFRRSSRAPWSCRGACRCWRSARAPSSPVCWAVKCCSALSMPPAPRGWLLSTLRPLRTRCAR